MIVVKVELWPGGNREAAQTLGLAIIANTGGSATSGEYEYSVGGKGGVKLRGGHISGFPRKRLLGWALVLRVLKDGFGDRNL